MEVPRSTGAPASIDFHWEVPGYIGGRTSVSLESSIDEYSLKRTFACFAAFLMPDEGVDENLESTYDRLRYYLELSSFPALSQSVEPAKFTGSVSGINPRPDFVIVDS